MRERGGALILNPGEACGWLHGTPTGAIVDLESMAIEFLELTGPAWHYGGLTAAGGLAAGGGHSGAGGKSAAPPPPPADGGGR